jgi:nicotinamide mononucleotide transporter
MDLISTLYQNLLATSWLEAIAVIAGLLSVWFARRGNILVYPIGIVSVLIYVYICYDNKLYADAGINAFYFLMSLFGWYNWARNIEGNRHIPIRFNTPGQNYLSLAGILLFFLILIYLLRRYTDSDVAVMDAFTTAVFIIAMWLMALKKVENWLAYSVGNLVSIPLYAYKGLILTSFQFLAFLILGIAGYIKWRREAVR